MSRAPALAAVTLSLALAGCSSMRTLPVLGAGPFETGGGLVLDEVLATAQAAGYLPEAIDAASGTFSVTARADVRGETRFHVQCTSDGFIVVRPRGPRIEPQRGGFRMPRHLAIEYEDLVASLEARDGTAPR